MMSKIYFDDLPKVDDIHFDNPEYEDIITMGLMQIKNNELEKQRYGSAEIHISSKLPSGMIDFATIGAITTGVQKVLNSAVKHIANVFGDPNASKKISDENELAIVDVKPGSFIIKFKPTSELIKNDVVSKQIKLGGLSESNTLERLDKLMVDLYSSTGQESGVEFKKRYGSSASKAAVKWLKELNQRETDFNYSGVNADEPKHFSSRRMKNIYTILDTPESDYNMQQVKVVGPLTAFNKKYKYIRIQDLTSDKEIKINVLDNSLKTAELLTNKNYKISVTKKSPSSLSSEEADEFEVQSLSNIQLL